MKTLYISDLDGTLLNSQAVLTDFTINTINSLIDQGMNFAIATARTSATVLKMLSGVNIKMPVILMNGVCIYDIAQGRYLKINVIPCESRKFIFSVLKEKGLSGFLYSIDNDKLSTFYENADSPNAKSFIKERVTRFGKVFDRVDSFSKCIGKNLVYYSVSDKKEKLLPAYEELASDSSLHVEFYRDIYNEDFWYLEICSCSASKYNAVNLIRDMYGFDRIVGFGDNLNDLPLFRACDESYAVCNAKAEVKERATGIIADNDSDGVARWLKAIPHNS